MLNQIVLVGRLTKDPEIITHDNNIKRTAVDLAVPRSYKNVDGVYETDYIKCVLWNGIAKNTCEYCKKGDLIGVKGRLQTSDYTDENQMRHTYMEVVAERVTFLSSKPKEEIVDDNDICDVKEEVKNDEKKSSKTKKKAE